MTVRELIERLQRLPPDLPVCVEGQFLEGYPRDCTSAQIETLCQLKARRGESPRYDHAIMDWPSKLVKRTFEAVLLGN